MTRSLHPFPARMAPELAIAKLQDLDPNSTVLDPMVGSGTVVRSAAILGHRAMGVDMDPLAILMTKVATTPMEHSQVIQLSKILMERAATLPDGVELPWIDEDEETRSFADRWFADPQKSDLRRLAYVLQDMEGFRTEASLAAMDALRLALSRIIITKERGASLARDVSHSRPHKVANKSDFAVFPAFGQSVHQIVSILRKTPPPGGVAVQIGDARNLNTIASGCIDAVLTSPPYLNAIDYMRGHRLALIWLGYRLASLREIRSNSVGAERGPDIPQSSCMSIQIAMAPVADLTSRHAAMIARYAGDVYRFMSEIARVLKPTGRASIVIGDCCLKGIFVRNSEGVRKAAEMVGLHLCDKFERELPVRNRYLPTPKTTETPLGKRLRTEIILTFVPA